ncbi:MAG TPA: DinB family protein [Thermomicrobiales bacterium]|nr:DinB family protein [Thermomicrobiales bacterium]
MPDDSPSPDSIVTALSAFPDELSRLLADQSRDALMAPASDGGPGVVELLPHLRDWEQIFLERIDAILSENHPTLSAHDDELWAIERDYRGQDPGRVLKEFLALRAVTVDHLSQLDETAWARTAEHETAGEINLLWVGSRLVESDADHAARIREALS